MSGSGDCVGRTLLSDALDFPQINIKVNSVGQESPTHSSTKKARHHAGPFELKERFKPGC